MNATVLHDVAIGSDCILAAGCVVRPGMVIPDGSFVAGIPAEIKGPATKEQLFWTVANPAAYPGLAEQYKKKALRVFQQAPKPKRPALWLFELILARMLGYALF